MKKIALFTLAMVATCDLIHAQEQPPTAPPYVEIIVTACPIPEENVEPCQGAQMGAQGLPKGMCPKTATPNAVASQNHPSKIERHAYQASIGCIDVPIPPEVIQGGEMTMEACMGHRGYTASMQYLEQNASIPQKSVGEWACIPHQYKPEGVASF